MIRTWAPVLGLAILAGLTWACPWAPLALAWFGFKLAVMVMALWMAGVTYPGRRR